MGVGSAGTCAGCAAFGGARLTEMPLTSIEVGWDCATDVVPSTSIEVDGTETAVVVVVLVLDVVSGIVVVVVVVVVVEGVLVVVVVVPVVVCGCFVRNAVSSRLIGLVRDEVRLSQAGLPSGAAGGAVPADEVGVRCGVMGASAMGLELFGSAEDAMVPSAAMTTTAAAKPAMMAFR